MEIDSSSSKLSKKDSLEEIILASKIPSEVKKTKTEIIENSPSPSPDLYQPSPPPRNISKKTSSSVIKVSPNRGKNQTFVQRISRLLFAMNLSNPWEKF